MCQVQERGYRKDLKAAEKTARWSCWKWFPIVRTLNYDFLLTWLFTICVLLLAILLKEFGQMVFLQVCGTGLSTVSLYLSKLSFVF